MYITYIVCLRIILFMKKKSMKEKMNGRGERREENGMENVKSSRKKRD